MTTMRDGTYLVTGATGRTGSHVVHRLVEWGARVRALVHTTQPEGLPAQGVQYVRGDYQDKDSLLRACEGVDWVVATVGAQAASRGLDLVEKVEHQGNVNIVDAAKAQGVKHLTLVSVRAADTRWTFYPVYVAKAQADQHLIASGLPFTLFRPGGIIDTTGAIFRGMAQQVRQGETMRVYGRPDQPQVYIFLDELAEYCARAHQVPQARNKVLELGGPVSPTRAELWRLIGEAVDREPRIEYRSPDELVPLREAAEKAENWPQAFALAREEIAGRFDSPAPDMVALGRHFGVVQRDIREFLRQALGGA